MSKNKFKSFLQFIGLSELVFNNNEAAVTLDQVTEASDKLEALTQENERLKAANALLSEDNKLFISKIDSLQLESQQHAAEYQKLKAENETLKKAPGAQSAKAITNTDLTTSETEHVSVTSQDKSFMENIQALEAEYPFLKR